jgi:hypothetical protein
MMAAEIDPPEIDPSEVARLADRIAVCTTDDEEPQAGVRLVIQQLLERLTAGTADERRAAQCITETWRERVG